MTGGGAIEVQFLQSIELTPETVLAVIMPEPFWDDKDVSKFVRDQLRADPLSYDCYHAQPNDDVREIVRVSREGSRDRTF
jgi:hypothetical protein